MSYKAKYPRGYKYTSPKLDIHPANHQGYGIITDLSEDEINTKAQEYALNFTIADEFRSYKVGSESRTVSSPIVKQVYIAITILAKGRGFTLANASHKLIAKVANVAEASVKRAVNALKLSGHLWVKHEYKTSAENGQNRRVASTYTLRKFKDWMIRKMGKAQELVNRAKQFAIKALSQKNPPKENEQCRETSLLYFNNKQTPTSYDEVTYMPEINQYFDPSTGEILNHE